MLILLSALGLAQDADPPADPPTASPTGTPTDAATVEILYTGHRGGVGSGLYPFSTLRHIHALDAELEVDLTDVAVFNGTLAQGDWLVRADDRRVGSVLSFFDGSAVTCGMPASVQAIQTDTDVTVLDRPGDTPLLAPLAEQALGTSVEHVVRRCRNAAGAEVILTGLTVNEPEWSLSEFELRTSLKLTFSDGAEMSLTGIPIQETARMMAQLTALRTEDGLYMDAGDFVDGASTVTPGELSLHRPVGFDMLRRLKPDALAPGHNELVGGMATLAEEMGELPYIATNWEAEDEALELPPYRIVQTAAGVSVGVVAILDPQLLIDLPVLAGEGISITDPVEAVQAVVDELYALPEPPDTVIALTTASNDVMGELRRRLRGIDVMLGDPSFATLRIEERAVTMRPLSPGVKGAPLTLSMDGITSARLGLVDGQLATVDSTPHLVRGQMPQDDAVRAAITTTRAATYPDLDVPLVPALAGLEVLSQDEFSQLVCEAVRSATRADSVMLRDLPPVRHLPGPLTELQLLDQLGMLDQLVVYQISGSKMLSKMERSYGIVPVSCGATVSNKKARGRLLESDRTYRVVTTDHTVDDPELGGILEALKPSYLLDGPGSRPLLDDAGRPVLLSQVVLDELRQVRDDGGSTDAVATWLEEVPSAYPPLTLLRLRGLDVSLIRFQGTENDAFAEVPETLATSPSSFTLSSDLDVALERSSTRLLSDLRFQGSYAAQRITGEDFAESADDWMASTSGTLAALAFPTGASLQWRPYSELLYDSEFSPTVDDTGAVNPRQADLSLAMGLSSTKVGILKNIRVGGFANQDLTLIGEKPTEFGGKTTWETYKKFSGMTWTTAGDAQVFASTRDDDATDLRLKVTAETRLAMPLARFLSVDLYAQGFALQGRVPTNDDFGFAWTLGSALDLSGAFEL